MLNFQDEVLNGNPSFEITDSNGNVISIGDVILTGLVIRQITEYLQEGTPLNKAFFDSIKTDFDNIINGVTVVGKALRDSDGNQIDTTYAKEKDLAEIAKTGSYKDLKDIPENLNVDQELNAESENAIANKVVTEALNNKQDALTFDETPTLGSANPVTSNGIYAVIGDVEALLSAI